MFSPEDRERVRSRVLAWASSDDRIAAGAIVGSLANKPGDRWSDLDLTFGVRTGAALSDVLNDWSHRLETEFEAIHLFDVGNSGAIYRVFVLPGCLQLDLSFSPAENFGAIGPNFRLLFGTAVQKPAAPPPVAAELFGYGVHHAVRGRVCIERRRYLQAEYWISGVRDNALSMACVRLGLAAHYGRGFDELPETLRGAAAESFVRDLERAELLRALRIAANLLVNEGTAAGVPASRVNGRLLDFISQPS
jgi:hypothetical protein